MLRNCILLLLVTSCFLTVGCGDSHEKVTRDSITLMKNMISVLENVKTVEDAKAARPKLESLAKRMKSIEARMKSLGKPSPELSKKLEEKYSAELFETLPRLMALPMSMSAEVRKELGDSPLTLPKSM